LDPLTQATVVDEMPDSDHSGPGNLPDLNNSTFPVERDEEDVADQDIEAEDDTEEK
jgi:hypothetical protein